MDISTLIYVIRIPISTFLFFIFVTFFSSSPNAEPISALSAVSTENTAEISLGKQLFHSEKLSADNSLSCASCHQINNGGDDGLSLSPGINGQLGSINTPTVLNSTLNFVQFWDGRASSLEEQVEGPVHNPIEMGSNWQQVITKLKADPVILEQFQSLYSDGITEKNIIRAIVSYENQLITVNAPFDLYLKGDKNAISKHAKEGYKLFKQMGCISCHQGKNVGGNMYQYFGVMGNYFTDRGNITKADLGRYNVTLLEKDKYKFKVPSLRNIANTAPYFHDGTAKTLEEAVKVMARYQLGRPISNTQVSSIKAFLISLSGELDEELK